MDLDLRGRSALITGGSKGIGFGIAKRLASEGVNVTLAARGADRLGEAAAELRKAYQVNVTTAALDLSDQAQRDRLVAAHPDVDILVNNAGAIPGGTIADVDDATWRTAWDLKVFGYINLTRSYLGRMKERKRGVILNVIGLGGERLDYGYIAGAAGNASLMAFTRAIGGTSPDFGVRVLGINPGPVETDRIEFLARQRAIRQLGDESRWRESFARMPYGRPAKVDEIAAMATFLASDLAAYISGTIITIDAGMMHRSGGAY